LFAPAKPRFRSRGYDPHRGKIPAYALDRAVPRAVVDDDDVERAFG